MFGRSSTCRSKRRSISGSLGARTCSAPISSSLRHEFSHARGSFSRTIQTLRACLPRDASGMQRVARAPAAPRLRVDHRARDTCDGGAARSARSGASRPRAGLLSARAVVTRRERHRLRQTGAPRAPVLDAPCPRGARDRAVCEPRRTRQGTASHRGLSRPRQDAAGRRRCPHRAARADKGSGYTTVWYGIIIRASRTLGTPSLFARCSR